MQDRIKTEDALKRLLDMFGSDWTAFNNLVVDFPVPREPQLPAPNRAKFRHDFLLEEAHEFKDSCASGDLDSAVDALIDLIYVAVGGLGEMGVLVQPTWAEVQRANMKKRRGHVDKPRSDGSGYDAIKPEGWTPPSHLPYLSITAADVEVLWLLKQTRETREPLTGVTLDGKTHWYNLTREELLLLNEAKAERSKPKQLQLKLGIDAGDALEKIRSMKPYSGNKPRILVLGHGRHGKDTVCEMLANEYDLKFTSSSAFCAERVIMPKLSNLWVSGELGMPGPYHSAQECYEDRHNHRAFWYEAIRDFNRPDATALGRAIWAENDVYCGLRSKAEFHALRNVGAFDVAIWVDASDRVPPEDASSCTVEPWMADYVLDNNGSLEDLELNLKQLMENVL